MFRESLAFDDVLLEPKYSDIESRSKINTKVSMGKYTFDHPIIPANMKTITGKTMAEEVIRSGGLAILHRFDDFDDQIRNAESIIGNHINNRTSNGNIAVSVGVKNIDRERVSIFYNAGIRIICIDIAHGDSKACIEMTSWIRKSYPDMFIIAGNVATGNGAMHLWEAGADACKVGVGSGSLCSTRIETGTGVAQLSALIDVYETRSKLIKNRKVYIISDGGCKSAGDLVKSLCFSDMVMTGNLFAGCDQCPGEKINIDGIPFKQYAGSSTHKTNHIEGVVALVPYKGAYNTVLTKLLEGIRSGCSYQGAHNLEELKHDPTFIRISNAGLVESHPHIKGKLI